MLRSFTTRAIVCGVLVGFVACNRYPERTSEERERARPPEGTSLLGEPLLAPPMSAEARAKHEANLDAAKQAYYKTPNDADTIIWLGRRTAYLNQFHEAIDIFTLGINKHPDDPRFYRHRGHRYITTRRLDAAVDDFEKAVTLIAGKPDEVEPDGLPNAKNIPTSTLQSNIWYHLGLAYYLQGDFPNALRAYRACMKVSTNPDMQVATEYWLYLTLRRAGEDAEAAALLDSMPSTLELIENQSYYRLLLMFKGSESADALWTSAQEGLDKGTIGYGIGAWHLISGRRDEAVAWLRRVLDESPWPPFGTIAAEADMARLGAPRHAS
ncbi:MAG: tetratricopeptide repeat protein [Vicinamibacterales bacterium]